MDAKQIEAIIDGWEKLTKGIEDALADDITLIDESDRWLPHLYASDINTIDISAGRITGSANVWTTQTGGSMEIKSFTIPLDTLNKYIDQPKTITIAGRLTHRPYPEQD